MSTARLIAITGLLLISSSKALAQVGTMPIPNTDTAVLETAVEIIPSVPGGQPTEYIYRYTVTNSISSSDPIYKFSVDISAEERDFRRPVLQTVPKQGGGATLPLQDEIDRFSPFFGLRGDNVVPIGLECPSGWTGGLRTDGTIVCYAANGTPLIAPGESLSGFAIHSRFPPTLRDIDSRAFWTVVVDSLEEEEDDIDRDAAFQVLENLKRPQRGLAPASFFPNRREHYSNFEADLAEMIALGWIPDAALAGELTTIVDDAGELFRTGQGVNAKLRLNDLETAIASATSGQILPDATSHLSVSVDSIQEFGSNSFLFGGLDTQFRPLPEAAELSIGETFELNIFVFRLNVFNFEEGVVEEPIPNRSVFIGCDDSAPVPEGVTACPNFPNTGFGNRVEIFSDANGIATFSYEGTQVGRDTLEVCGDSFCEGDFGPIVIDWGSDVDLVIQAFSPPVILTESGETITFTDRTVNLGASPSGLSMTAYYISDDQVVDPDTAVFVGDRDVPALLPGEVSEQVDLQLSIPAGFALDTHYLIACADDQDEVVESNELNNCSNIQLEGSEFVAIPVADFDDLFVVTVNDASVIEGDSGTTDVLVDIELSQPNPDSAITFDYVLDDGTASIVDGDYVDTSGTISFPAGSGGPQTQQVLVSVVGDTQEEGDETVMLRITPIAGDALYRTTLATITIVNDDSLAELDCTTALASPNSLWPPNHKLVNIVFSGITTQDGEPAQISVTRIEQDEPVNGLGDGDTSPDGFGVGTDNPQVRRERSGTGDGRVYFIGFDVTDSSTGASCSGTVSVGVPHDQGQGSVPIDSGLRVDSTLP